MERYDVQSIEMNVSFDEAFAFLSDDSQLPRWTNAFASVQGDRAIMRTGGGQVTVTLESRSSPHLGTIDWVMRFPDGSEAFAFSRLVGGDDHCVFSFILPTPPGSLEALEGDLAAQSVTLAEELRRAKEILEREPATAPGGGTGP